MVERDGIPALLERHHVPGLSLAYRVGDGPAVTRSWGVASTEDRAPVTPATLFQAGSISKVVTAFAALRLAADGRLDLDADVNSVLTSWRLPAVWGWQPAVTVRMLLAHVAGVHGGWGGQYDVDEPLPSLRDVLDGRGRTLPITLEALPGLGWSYSGGGYQIVAQVICDLTGLGFSDAMAALVLDPLGMSASTYAQPLPEQRHTEAARGQVYGRTVPGGWRNHPDLGATGLWTTPADLMRFAGAVNSDAAPQLLRGHPVQPRMGLGAFLTSAGGVDWWSHNGAVAGFEARLAGVAASARRFAVAIMTNGAEGGAVVDEVFRLVSERDGPGLVELTDLFGESIGTFVQRTADQERMVGRYALPSGGEVAITAPMGEHVPEPHLLLPGQSPVKLIPVAQHRWRVPGLAGTDIDFDPPDTLRLRQHGYEVRAVRLP